MLAQTPPMGWNSWNTFGKDVNEDIVLRTADVMAEKGYRDAGYEYVVVDDCWSLLERDKNGNLVADPEKFPHGMKYVADYIHSKGLKFGIYSAAGIRTCAGYPGSFGHEYQDAELFASWGVDFLKYDLCHYPGKGDCRNSYLTMSLALRSTGREILYSAATVGERNPHDWMRSVGAHMYRSTGDIIDKYESFRDIAISQIGNMKFSAPGTFNDMDMLVVGMSGKGNVSKFGGCTDEEYKMHFVLWCLFGTPLMMGGDLTKINDYCHDLLINKNLIAINQDPECRPPFIEEKARYHCNARMSFLKLLSNNEMVFAYFNFCDDPLEVLSYFDDFGIPSSTLYGLELTDVFTGECIGVKHDYFTPKLPPRSCCLYKARIIK